MFNKAIFTATVLAVGCLTVNGCAHQKQSQFASAHGPTKKVDHYQLSANAYRDRNQTISRRNVSTEYGPTVLCDEKGARSVSIPEREKRAYHDTEISYVTDRRIGYSAPPSINDVDGAVLKVSLEGY